MMILNPVFSYSSWVISGNGYGSLGSSWHGALCLYAGTIINLQVLPVRKQTTMEAQEMLSEIQSMLNKQTDDVINFFIDAMAHINDPSALKELAEKRRELAKNPSLT